MRPCMQYPHIINWHTSCETSSHNMNTYPLFSLQLERMSTHCSHEETTPLMRLVPYTARTQPTHCSMISHERPPLIRETSSIQYEHTLFYHLMRDHLIWEFHTAWIHDTYTLFSLRDYHKHSISFFLHTAKDKSEKTFAFAFMKIMRDDGSIIPDGSHDLYVYKVSCKK